MEVESYIRTNCTWNKLPRNIKQVLGNSQREYEKQVVEYSVKNQLRYKGNIIRHVKKNEEQYYQLLLQYSREHLMLYPYHLSDIIVRGLRITPFAYYIDMMQDLMTLERSYDSLPNFTAADCLRLLGIGRNQYIDLMNRCRSGKVGLNSLNSKFFRKKPPRDILPSKPVEIRIEPWFIVERGHILEEDVRQCSPVEKKIIDALVDEGRQLAGTLDMRMVKKLYERGLVFFDIPIYDTDTIVVPPLDGFVMNRVLGDYFENLLYKIFVSIDEHTTVAELASNVLQIDLPLVKNAVSAFCRLGFAYKKNSGLDSGDLHPSWRNGDKQNDEEDLMELLAEDAETPTNESLGEDFLLVSSPINSPSSGCLVDSTIFNADCLLESGSANESGLGSEPKRMAFLFDSTLTAFLMMGNLSSSLKSHAVTLFEVGKLTEESLDGFLEELEKVVKPVQENDTEAGVYWEHACVLRETLKFLRKCGELDLLRCESLSSLERAARCRVLKKNYRLLVSMAPLCSEIVPVNVSYPPHIGPPIGEVNSPWFKLFIYHLTGCGPTSILIAKGTRLRRLPKALHGYRKLLMNSWSHDPGIVSSEFCLPQLNDALQHSAVFVQFSGCSLGLTCGYLIYAAGAIFYRFYNARFESGYEGYSDSPEVVHIPFPAKIPLVDPSSPAQGPLCSHSCIAKLCQLLDLHQSIGYVTLLRMRDSTDNTSSPQHGSKSSASSLSGPIPPSASLVETALSDASSCVVTNESQPLCDAPDDVVANEIASSTVALETLNVAAGGGGYQQDPRRCMSSHVTENGAKLYADWLLFDCAFGMPLFDRELNEQLCHRFSTTELLSEQRLSDLREMNRKLAVRLLDFVHRFHPNLTSQRIGGGANQERVSSFPVVSLIFEAGKVSHWSADHS